MIADVQLQTQSSPAQCSQAQSLAAETLRVLQDFAAARLKRDYARLVTIFHPDARFVLPSSQPLAYFGGECHSARMICDMFRQSDALLESYDFKLYPPLIDGNHGAARWDTMQRNRGTGNGVLLSGAGFLTQVDGLITEYFEFFDTAAVATLVNI